MSRTLQTFERVNFVAAWPVTKLSGYGPESEDQLNGTGDGCNQAYPG